MKDQAQDILIPDLEHTKPGLRWLPAVWFAILFLVSYRVVLYRLARQWMTDPDLSHACFVPVLVAYIVWERREALAALKPTHSIFGLFLMVLGGFLLCVGPPGLDTYAAITRLAFLISLAGIILYLRGYATLRMLFYPLGLLLLMFPVPGFVLEKVTFPLQILASQLAERVLEFLGYSVLREGNVLLLPGQTLNIAEACSGLRSLFALTFLSQAYIYLFDSRPGMRAVMFALVVPIAVFANCLRIVASAVAATYNRAWGHGTYHESTGWIMFLVAFICVVGAHLTINKLVKRAGMQ